MAFGEVRWERGSVPFMLTIEDETFGQPFRRGQETRAEQTVHKFGGEPEKYRADASNGKDCEAG